jgi:hypothetical protein
VTEPITPPAAAEHASFHQSYLDAVAGRDVRDLLRAGLTTIERVRRLSPVQAASVYAPGKWSVKRVLGHMADGERVTTYRLMCIARGDTANLPGFEQDDYDRMSNADARSVASLADELHGIRLATIALVDSLDATMLGRRGTANGWSLTVRALVFITAGHFEHHRAVLNSRYGLDL